MMSSGSRPATTSFLAPDALASLDSEIVRIQDTLVDLKRRRNSCLPIARIPPELLSEIFLHFCDASTVPSDIYCARISWISILHISSHWREVGLGDPRLWNTVNLRFPDLARYCFAQFKGLPRRIVLSQLEHPEDWPDAEDYLNVVRDNQITAIEMYGHDEEVSFRINDILSITPNNLVFLELGSQPKANMISSLGFPSDVALPNLQTLWLSHLSTSLDGTTFASCALSLRELRLCNCFIFQEEFDNLVQFKSLQTLQLIRSCYEVDGCEINMPALAVLHLEDHADECLAIIRRLNLPAARQVVIIPCYDPGELDVALVALSSLLSLARPRCESLLKEEHILEILLGRPQGVPYSLRLSETFFANHNEIFAHFLQPDAGKPCIICDLHMEFTTPSEVSMPGTRCTSVRVLELEKYSDLHALSASLVNTLVLPKLAVLRVSEANFNALPPEAAQRCRDGLLARGATLVLL